MTADDTLLTVLRDMVIEQIDYCDLNHLGDATKKHNVKRALVILAAIEGKTVDQVVAQMKREIEQARAYGRRERR